MRCNIAWIDFPEQALESLKQAEMEAKTSNNPLNSCLITYNYGKIYQGLKEYTKAIKYYEKNLELATFLPQMPIEYTYYEI